MVRLDSMDQFLATELGTASAALLLRKAIGQAGPNTYRNAATLGGICASRLSDSELLSALLVMEAVLVYREQAAGVIGLAEYLADDEPVKGLITEIVIPWSDGQGASERVARTPKDYPIVSITAWEPVSQSIRLAGTGLGERPKRLLAAEVELQGVKNEAAVAAAAAAASAANEHPGDFRGDATPRHQGHSRTDRCPLPAGWCRAARGCRDHSASRHAWPRCVLGAEGSDDPSGSRSFTSLQCPHLRRG